LERCLTPECHAEQQARALRVATRFAEDEGLRAALAGARVVATALDQLRQVCAESGLHVDMPQKTLAAAMVAASEVAGASETGRERLRLAARLVCALSSSDEHARDLVLDANAWVTLVNATLLGAASGAREPQTDALSALAAVARFPGPRASFAADADSLVRFIATPLLQWARGLVPAAWARVAVELAGDEEAAARWAAVAGARSAAWELAWLAASELASASGGGAAEADAEAVAAAAVATLCALHRCDSRASATEFAAFARDATPWREWAERARQSRSLQPPAASRRALPCLLFLARRPRLACALQRHALQLALLTAPGSDAWRATLLAAPDSVSATAAVRGGGSVESGGEMLGGAAAALVDYARLNEGEADSVAPLLLWAPPQPQATQRAIAYLLPRVTADRAIASPAAVCSLVAAACVACECAPAAAADAPTVFTLTAAATAAALPTLSRRLAACALRRALQLRPQGEAAAAELARDGAVGRLLRAAVGEERSEDGEVEEREAEAGSGVDGGDDEETSALRLELLLAAAALLPPRPMAGPVLADAAIAAAWALRRLGSPRVAAVAAAALAALWRAAPEDGDIAPPQRLALRATALALARLTAAAPAAAERAAWLLARLAGRVAAREDDTELLRALAAATLAAACEALETDSQVLCADVVAPLARALADAAATREAALAGIGDAAAEAAVAIAACLDAEMRGWRATRAARAAASSESAATRLAACLATLARAPGVAARLLIASNTLLYAAQLCEEAAAADAAQSPALRALARHPTVLDASLTAPRGAALATPVRAWAATLLAQPRARPPQLPMASRLSREAEDEAERSLRAMCAIRAMRLPPWRGEADAAPQLLRLLATCAADAEAARLMANDAELTRPLLSAAVHSLALAMDAATASDESEAAAAASSASAAPLFARVAAVGAAPQQRRGGAAEADAVLALGIAAAVLRVRDACARVRTGWRQLPWVFWSLRGAQQRARDSEAQLAQPQSRRAAPPLSPAAAAPDDARSAAQRERGPRRHNRAASQPNVDVAAVAAAAAAARERPRASVTAPPLLSPELLAAALRVCEAARAAAPAELVANGARREPALTTGTGRRRQSVVAEGRAVAAAAAAAGRDAAAFAGELDAAFASLLRSEGDESRGALPPNLATLRAAAPRA
jgi:hypothetical protein